MASQCPSGSMLRTVRQGAELHLITLTAGENGRNPDNHPDIADVRLQEWREAGRLIGATTMHHLGFTDGTLDNTAMLEAVERIRTFILDHTPQTDETPYEVEIISMDTNGITGHIDHIVTSRAAHHVFYDLKHQSLPVSRLLLACIPRSFTDDQPNLDFVFMEPGRTPEEIDEVHDNNDLKDDVIAIVHAHHTQREDAAQHIQHLGTFGVCDYFIVKE